jgi:(1->4)-alpha-D-glucan 1-alpha-D-glucosylmutase
VAEAGGLLHDPAGEVPLTQLWVRFTDSNADFASVELAARTELVRRLFAAELGRTVRSFAAAATTTGGGRDLAAAALERSIAAVASHFPVYRTYPDGETKPLERALAATEITIARAERPWLDRLRAMLAAPDRRVREGQVRFQLLTAPLAAKAVEDTTFYRYGRLLSQNEVGASPQRFAITPADFHQAMIARQQRFPHGMLATATHDHKRGEDVRGRLAVLSEIPTTWAGRVETWRVRNDPGRQTLPDGAAPSSADELMLYQTLVAAWPALLDPADDAGAAEFAGRVAGWQQKALREAKQRSDWAEPNEAYETACRDFMTGLLADRSFRQEIANFATRIGPAGAVNGLAQTMLRLTVPGVPDLYQGTEFWDESLVDPDNRRPVDFAARERALGHVAPWSELLRDWRTGQVKQALIARMLALRAQMKRLFAAGGYRPLALAGPRANHALAFLREDGTNCLMVAVARLSVPLLGDVQMPWITPAAWRGTVLHVPRATWHNALVPAAAAVESETLELATVFRDLPVACWMSGNSIPDSDQ